MRSLPQPSIHGFWFLGDNLTGSSREAGLSPYFLRKIIKLAAF
jgi:hypothetical protein